MLNLESFVTIIFVYLKEGILSVYGEYGVLIFILYQNIIMSIVGNLQVAIRFSINTICLY